MGNITELSQGSLDDFIAYYKARIDQAKQEGYDIGLEIGKKQAISELPEVANKENEMYDRGVEDLSKAIVWYNNLKHSERVKYIGGNLGIYRLIEDTPQEEKLLLLELKIQI